MPIDKPSDKEDEYFARQELERKSRLIDEAQLRMALQEKMRLKELHYMRCPKCGMELIEIGFKGVTLDKCSSCAGVWLDCGEIEEVLKKESGFLQSVVKIFQK